LASAGVAGVLLQLVVLLPLVLRNLLLQQCHVI
jgi:hypothetical protein